MTSTTTISPLARYRKKFADTPGFLLEGAVATWDFLLTCQRNMNLSGNIVEIGVFRGKSALLAACHMQPGERLILNDVSAIDEPVAKIRSLHGPEPIVAISKSSALLSNPDLTSFFGTARWVHVDGDHTGFNATNDLEVAERFLGDMGVICVDDFFNLRYPQVTAATYAFLQKRFPLFRMLLCGAGKAYIVRSADFTLYEALIRKFLAGHFKGCGFEATIHKSTDTADMGCFSIGSRQQDRDYLGLDQDHDLIPY